MEKPYFVHVLEDEFQKRKAKNPHYSMRAFAGAVGVHASSLCRIFAGKEDLAVKSALGVASKISLSDSAKRLFLQSVVEVRKEKERSKMGEAIGAPELRPQLTAVNPQDCAMVFNLEAHALLQLTLTDGFLSNTEFISKRLGIEPAKVEQLIESLVKFGLLEKKDGVIVNPQASFTAVKNESTDELRKNHQMRILERAAESVRKDDFSIRANYSVSAAIDPSKMPVVREKVLKFLESLTDELESGARTEVYQLNFNIFPLSKPL